MLKVCVRRAVLIAGLPLLAGGCHLPEWVQNGFKLGPEYQQPPAATAENWIDSDDTRIISEPLDYPDWWSALEDPVLSELIEKAYEQNLTLREAGLRVLEARAQRAIVIGNLFPQSQQAFGGYDREQVSFEAPAPFEPSGIRRYGTWELGLMASWELDIWGRFRRAIETADANLEASIHEYDAVLVCMIAEVATAYVDIRTFEQRLKYARQNVEIQGGSLELAQTRAREGKTGDISVHLSESNLEGTRATIPSLETDLRQANNRLCTLLGMPPVDLKELLGEDHEIPTAPAEVAIGIPGDLLRRRPDVRAAESQVAAQSALIGVAMSDLYPSISITGEVFVQSEDFGDLFTSLSYGGSVSPSFRWNILNYGRLLNNVRVQETRFQELVTSYQNTVLTANEEAENALVAFLQSQRRAQLLGSSAEATRLALDLALIRFKEGVSDFTGVFVLQSDLVQKQDQWAAARGEIITSLITAYKALGGGWEFRGLNHQSEAMAVTDPADQELESSPLPPLDNSIEPGSE